MKNRYSEELRKYHLPYLKELEDFRFKKLFGNRQTSSAIIICSKKNNRNDFLYVNGETQVSCSVAKDSLRGKWSLDVLPAKKTGKKRFGDCFKVSAPIATLLNEAFVINDFTDRGEWIEKDGFRLEKTGVRPAASPKSKQNRKESYIIFPYYYNQSGCC